MYSIFIVISSGNLRWLGTDITSIYLSCIINSIDRHNISIDRLIISIHRDSKSIIQDNISIDQDK